MWADASYSEERHQLPRDAWRTWHDADDGHEHGRQRHDDVPHAPPTESYYDDDAGHMDALHSPPSASDADDDDDYETDVGQSCCSAQRQQLELEN